MSSDVWQYWYPKKEQTIDEDIPKLEELFRRKSVLKILDLGCGTGRHLIDFAKKGFQTYGFDLSENAIWRVKENLEKENLSADVRVWEMAKS